MLKQLPHIGSQNLKKPQNSRNSFHTASTRFPNRIQSVKSPQLVNSSTNNSNVNNIQLSYCQRFNHVTRISDYNSMNDQQIWREYEKLRKSLKILNEEILFEIEKKALNGIKKVSEVKEKTSDQKIRVLQQQKRVMQVMLKSKKEQLQGLQNRFKILSKQNVKQLFEKQIQQINGKINVIKNQKKQMQKKTRMLSKQLVNVPAYFQKMFSAQDQLNFAQKKLSKLRSKITQTQKQMNQSIDKINQITKAINSRKQQFNVAERYVEQQINISSYQQLKNKQQNLKKYESPYKKNYLVKLKQLEALINSIHHNETVISQSQKSILNIRTEIQSINNILIDKKRDRPTEKKRNQLNGSKLDNDNKRHSSMMVQRDQTQKNDKNDITVITPFTQSNNNKIN